MQPADRAGGVAHLSFAFLLCSLIANVSSSICHVAWHCILVYRGGVAQKVLLSVSGCVLFPFSYTIQGLEV